MADIVAQVLSQTKKDYKPIEVEKDIELALDLRNLLATDKNALGAKRFRSSRDSYLQSLARDNTQYIINHLWKLPTETTEGVILAKLPLATTLIPRAKRIPKERPPTKWEEFARAKGIQKKKKEKLVWDEVSKEWKPRWGYRSAKNQEDWLIELPDNADPLEDQFEKRKQTKKERIAKNEFQRLRNIARSKKIKVPAVGLTPTEKPSKEQVTKALALAKTSTASLGKFTDALPDEKPPKKLGKKRKFESNFGNASTEAQKHMKIFQQLQNKKPKLDVTKAVNMHLNQEESEGKKRNKGKGRKSKQTIKKARGRNHKGKMHANKKASKAK